MYIELWIVVVAFVVGVLLAFSIGANDVANSFGTSVGSKVLTIRNACILATISETAGAVLLGQKVGHTIQKGIVDVDIYSNATEELAVGQVSALAGASLWLLIATVFSLPVSGTHSIVGAIIGFSLVARGLDGINWETFGKIVASWFVSPLMSGLLSCGLFYFVNKFCLDHDETLKRGLFLLPIFYGITISVNLFSIFYKGPVLLRFDEIPFYGIIIISLGSGILVAILVWFLAVPILRRKIKKILAERSRTRLDSTDTAEAAEAVFRKNGTAGAAASGPDENSAHPNYDTAVRDALAADADEVEGDEVDIHTTGDNANNVSAAADDVFYLEKDTVPSQPHLAAVETPGAGPGLPPSAPPPHVHVHQTRSRRTFSLSSITDHSRLRLLKERALVKDKPEAVELFRMLQILTAIFGGFAHGGNDVSNAIGPASAAWLLYTTGNVDTPTPVWILALGGLGITMGLWALGRRVIKTMGEDLAVITPSSGFCVELGAAVTVLIASNFGIPISTTHCKVGSVTFVGLLRSRYSVDWKLFGNIALAWFVTVPAAASFSAAIMAVIQEVI